MIDGWTFLTGKTLPSLKTYRLQLMRRMSGRENERGSTTGWSLQWGGGSGAYGVKIRKHLKCTLQLSGEVETDR